MTAKLYLKNETVENFKDKIIGGYSANIVDFPHQVFVRSSNTGCGGSIISRSHILTAAHCVEGDKNSPDSILVRSGSSNKNLGGVLSKVSHVIIHEDFDGEPPYNVNDIAILVLSEPLKFDNNTQKILLISREVKNGEEAYVSGWGVTDNNRQQSETLKALRVHVGRGFGCWLLGLLADTICVKTPNAEGICFGDSGGPLTIQGYLAGVASFITGSKCGTDESPMFYMSIPDFKDWIEEKIESQKTVDSNNNVGIAGKFVNWITKWLKG